MPRFRHAHATHPQWQMALDIALAQIAPLTDSQPADGLGFLYVTDRLAADLPQILASLRDRTQVAHWSGAVASSICATGVEYDDQEPALALMLASLPPDSFRVFSGRHRLPSPAEPVAGAPIASHTALVHADPSSPDLVELIHELSQRTATGFLVGALTSGGPGYTQIADEAMAGGMSGVLFSSSVRLLTRVTQGCAPLAGEHLITECTEQYVQELDGRPALDVLLQDLGVELPAGHQQDGEAILRALPAQRLRHGLFVGLNSGDGGRTPGFGDYLVRQVVGIDPHNRLLAIAEQPAAGERLVFCTRDREAARRDLVRIVSELRTEVEDEGLSILGALYHTCVARGSSLFGSSGEELETIQHHLGDVPLVGMYGNGEIARDRLYAFTGVLTLFVETTVGD